MHVRTVLYVLGNLLLVLGGMMLAPLAVALVTDNPSLPASRYEELGFFVAIAVALIAGGTLRTLFEANMQRLGNREGAAIVTLAWVVFSLVGCLPLIITGVASFTDAYFETISGFTTTGASVLTRLEDLPHGLMFWRCQTQWMGGMGIVVLSVAILPFVGMGGYRMFKAEVPGGATFERNAPRIRDTAKLLWMLYLGISLLQTLLLWLAGMRLYDAVCHTFTTMSTGGYSTSGKSLAGWPAPAVQWIVIAFMFAAGANFAIYQGLLQGKLRALRDQELQIYALLAVVTIGLVSLELWRSGEVGGGAEGLLRASAFQVVSIGTTTGYGTEDFDRWPDALRLLLVMLMFIGGCSGSTGGGMKVVRLVIFFKAVLAELRRVITPRAVLVVRVGKRSLDREVISNVMGFLAMYVGLAAAVTLALAFLGMDLVSALSATAANLGNIGPGLGTVGPTLSYAGVPLVGKWLLVLCQLLGRLELYSVMVLLLKRTWVR
jgi:trk system potassium uptake protein TrkH